MEKLSLSSMISEKEIQKRVKEIASALNDKFRKEPSVVAVCVLKGSSLFYADLVRELNFDVVTDFVSVSSYHDSHKSSGEVKMNMDISASITGKTVILIEDIVDTGLTMEYLKMHVMARLPKSLTTIALLFKPKALKVACKIDHVGFEISNDFVVGYGLDYQGYYRNLPYIARVQNLN